MAAFEVTTEDLHSLADRLGGLVGELQAAVGAIRSDAAAAAQNARLEASVDGFLEDWSNGLEGLRSDLTAVSQRLGAAAGAYEGTDSNIASRLGPR